LPEPNKKPLDTKDKTVVHVKKMIDVMSSGQFYGELNLKFENGKIILCRRTETMKF
jgi:hypothetical protein